MNYHICTLFRQDPNVDGEGTPTALNATTVQFNDVATNCGFTEF